MTRSRSPLWTQEKTLRISISDLCPCPCHYPCLYTLVLYQPKRWCIAPCGVADRFSPPTLLQYHTPEVAEQQRGGIGVIPSKGHLVFSLNDIRPDLEDEELMRRFSPTWAYRSTSETSRSPRGSSAQRVSLPLSRFCALPEALS